MAPPSVNDPHLACPLCHSPGGDVLWRAPRWRLVLVDDVDYPGYCRVIWQAHVAEMSELTAAERSELMDAVFAVETVLREQLQPDKINLASLGNQVPHLHWHVIPRFADDAQFPDAIWAARRRATSARNVDLRALRQALIQRCAPLGTAGEVR